jgi:SsrA-binding protein
VIFLHPIYPLWHYFICKIINKIDGNGFIKHYHLTKAKEKIEFINRKATFGFLLLDTYVAGMVLSGTEIKSIRQGKINITDAYCYFRKDELYVKNLHISEYSHRGYSTHDPLAVRKLLLNKRELKKLQTKIKEKGLTIIPTRLFINERGFAKLEIALAKGKKTFDKRESIKERESKVKIKQIVARRR